MTGRVETFVEDKKERGEKGIHEAVGSDPQLVRLLVLQNPLLLHSLDTHLNTPLHVAIQRKDTSLVSFLITHGADVNAKDIHGSLLLLLLLYQLLFSILTFFQSANLLC